MSATLEDRSFNLMATAPQSSIVASCMLGERLVMMPTRVTRS